MTRNTGEHDDMACLFFAQYRKSGFYKVHLAEEDRFELIADEILGGGGR